MVQHGLRVVAMDLVLAMVQAARSYGQKKGLVGSYVVGNAVSLPFCDACFDGVAMLGAIIAHVPGRDGRVQALRAVSRTLRPGGKLAMTTHNRRCHWKFQLYFACVNRFRRLARRLGLGTSLVITTGGAPGSVRPGRVVPFSSICMILTKRLRIYGKLALKSWMPGRGLSWKRAAWI